MLISGRSASDLATLMAKFKLVCLNDVEDIDDFWQIALSGSGEEGYWEYLEQERPASTFLTYNVQFCTKHIT